jgi:hypothetical protein
MVGITSEASRRVVDAELFDAVMTMLEKESKKIAISQHRWVRVWSEINGCMRNVAGCIEYVLGLAVGMVVLRLKVVGKRMPVVAEALVLLRNGAAHGLRQ